MAIMEKNKTQKRQLELRIWYCLFFFNNNSQQEKGKQGPSPIFFFVFAPYNSRLNKRPHFLLFKITTN